MLLKMKLLCLIIIISIIGIHLSCQEPHSLPRIIVDVDVGADDAFALLTLLYAERIGLLKVEAILCSTGNTHIEHGCKNLVRVLESVKRTDIPVYKGAYRNIVPAPEDLPKRFFFGKDGFGELQYNSEPDLSIISDVPAVMAIHELVIKNPKQLTMVCLGPLTTSALAMLLFKDFAPNLKQMWIMGGNYKVKGNITEHAEFNFFLDPESAEIVLNNGIYPVILLTWDTCLGVGITMDWRFNVLGKQRSLFMDLLNKVERSVFQDENLDSFWNECDAFLAVAGVFPEIILEKSLQNVEVELKHFEARGKLIFNKSNSPNVKVVVLEKLDVEAVKNVLLAAASIM